MAVTTVRCHDGRRRDLGRGGLEAHAIRTRIENVFLSRIVLTSALTHWCVRKKINVCEMCFDDIDTALCPYRRVISPEKMRTATTVTRGGEIAPTVAHDPRQVCGPRQSLIMQSAYLVKRRLRSPPPPGRGSEHPLSHIILQSPKRNIFNRPCEEKTSRRVGRYQCFSVEKVLPNRTI